MRTARVVPAAILVALSIAGCKGDTHEPNKPTSLSFWTHPQGEQVAGLALAPAVQVAVTGAGGRIVEDGSFTVTVGIENGTGSPGATLGGTLTRATVGGLALFDDLVIQAAGTGYRLVATVSGGSLGEALSGPFTVKAGAATRLAFATQPSTTIAGTTFASPVRVMMTDDYGNLVQQQTQTQVTIAIEGVVPVAGDTTAPLRFTRSGTTVTPINPLAGTLTAELLAGIATFPSLRPRTSGDYDVAGNLRPRLVATAPGLASATSDRFTVTPAPTSRVWVAVPTCTGSECVPPFPPAASHMAGVSFTATAYLLDSLNNRTNSGTDAISLALGSNPGGAAITSAPASPTVNGRATFQVSVTNSGSGYTIVGSAAGATGVPSFPFDILPATTQWTLRDSLPEARNSMYAAEAGGKIYVQAGSGGFPTFYGTLRVYDPVANSWQAHGDNHTARAFSSTNSAVVNGVLHIVAGNPSGSCTVIHETYNTATSTWDVLASAPTDRCHAASVAHGEAVYLVGGWNASSTVRFTQVDIWTPATSAWSAGVPLPDGTFRGGMAAVAHGGKLGKLYLFGGTISTEDPCTNTVLALSFTGGSWEPMAPMSTDRCGPAAVVAANGRIYVAGGRDDAGNALATVESYDPATNSWRPEPAMSIGRQSLALVRVGDWLYAIGGHSGSVTFRSMEALQVP